MSVLQPISDFFADVTEFGGEIFGSARELTSAFFEFKLFNDQADAYSAYLENQLASVPGSNVGAQPAPTSFAPVAGIDNKVLVIGGLIVVGGAAIWAASR